MRIADVDGHAAATFLGEPIGIDPGQRAQQCGLAMVDVSGGPDDDGHRRPERVRQSQPQRGIVGRVHGPKVEMDRSILDPADDRRIAGAQPTGEGRRSRAAHDEPHRRKGLPGQRSAADRRGHRRDLDLRTECVREIGHDGVPTAAERVGAGGDHPPHRDVCCCPTRAVQAERRGERRQRDLLRSNRARQRVLPDPGDQVRPTNDQTGLRSTHELVTAERDQVRTGLESLARRWLVREAIRHGVEERAAAEVVDDDRAVEVRKLREGARIRRFDEARLGEVGRMDAQDDGRAALGEGRLEVGRSRPVGCPDLDETSPGTADHVGDPDATADLDELAPRDRDAASAGKPDREQERRRVIDGDDRVFRAGEGDQVCLCHPEPRPASPRVAIELEQGIGGGGSAGGLDGRSWPRRATEVRVEDDPGGVDDRREPGRRIRQRIEACGDRLRQVLQSGRRFAGGDCSPLHLDRFAGGRGKCHGLELARTRPRPDRGKQPFDAGGTRAIRRHWSSVAGTRGSRTHRAAPSAAPLVLKTRGPTGTRPLPARW